MHHHKTIILLLLSVCVLSFTTYTNPEKAWVLKKNEKGVIVYNRDIENSSLKEIKAVTQIKTSLSSIIALLNDKESFPKWVYKCGKSYVIKQVNEMEAICYQNVVAPWPVDNRDIVIDVKVKQDPLTKIVTQNATSTPSFIPGVDNHVRIISFNATWTLTPLKNGMINCEYQLLFDPGGNIPIWLVNLAATDGPFETTCNMREIIKNEKYQKTQYAFIIEP